MASLNKVVKINLSDQICALLREKISSGDYPVGSKLPSETELASAFGVSRLTVRMALQKLSAQGLVISKAGDGTFVKEFDIAQYMDEVSDITLKPEMLDSVLEFRRCLEGTAIHYVIDRASDAEIDGLEALLHELQAISFHRDTPESEWNLMFDQYIELDYLFHATICKISGNSLFYLSYVAARAPICAYLRKIMLDRIDSYKEEHPEKASFNLEEITLEDGNHAGIVNAIRSRNHDTCTAVFHGPIDYKLRLTHRSTQ